MDVHLVDGTYELFRYHFLAGEPGPGAGGDGRGGAVGAGAGGRRGDPRGGRHRPRHRVVPQRPVAHLQDLGGHAAGAARPVPRSSRRPCGPPGFVVWAMVEVEADDAMASARGRGRRRRPGRPGASSARPTRTSASASSTAGWGSGTAARTSGSTPPASRSASACRPSRCPTSSPSSATPPTASRPPRGGGQVGGRRPSGAGATSRTSPPTRSTWDSNVRGAPKLNLTLQGAVVRGPAVPAHRHRRARPRRRHRRRLGVDRSGRPRSASLSSAARPSPTGPQGRRHRGEAVVNRPTNIVLALGSGGAPGLRPHRRHPGPRGAGLRASSASPGRRWVPWSAASTPPASSRSTPAWSVGLSQFDVLACLDVLAVGPRRHPGREDLRQGPRAPRRHPHRGPPHPLHGRRHRPPRPPGGVVPAGPARRRHPGVDRHPQRHHPRRPQRPAPGRRRPHEPDPGQPDAGVPWPTP